jgi:spore maturation protein SpmA
MLNYIWLGLILCAVTIGGYTGRMKEVSGGAFEMAEHAVLKIALPLLGIMALWLGIMRLAERSGMVQFLARLLRPVLVRLFPDVPADHPAMGSMLMNIAANMLGLSNAATPLGLRAMKDLDRLNPRPGTASNAMCTFLAINTSSVQLIPVTAVGILAGAKSTDPSSIIGTAFLATLCAAISAITAVKLLEKLPFFRLPPVTAEDAKKKSEETQSAEEAASQFSPPQPVAWWGTLILAVYFLFFAGLFFSLAFPEMFGRTVSPDLQRDSGIIRAVKTLSLLSIPLLLSFFPLYAAVRRIKVYEEFVEGAKEGFQVIIRIIPNLVAILVAIGMFRGAGGIALITDLLRPVMNLVNFPPELLPMALIRPLSGSGTLGVFTDLVKNFGPDHMLSRMAGTIYGSTETTFYVLAVYFGAVGIKRTRHAVPAGLVADVVGVVASVIICRLVFS